MSMYELLRKRVSLVNGACVCVHTCCALTGHAGCYSWFSSKVCRRAIVMLGFNIQENGSGGVMVRFGVGSGLERRVRTLRSGNLCLRF